MAFGTRFLGGLRTRELSRAAVGCETPKGRSALGLGAGLETANLGGLKKNVTLLVKGELLTRWMDEGQAWGQRPRLCLQFP